MPKLYQESQAFVYQSSPTSGRN